MLDLGFLSVSIPLSYAALTDIKSRQIPDKVHFMLIGIGIIRIITGHISLFDSIAGLIALMFPLILIVCISNNNDLGGGDIKICGALGFAVGGQLIIAVVIIAGMLLIIFNLFNKRKSLPFAPFLWAGFIICGGVLKCLN